MKNIVVGILTIVVFALMALTAINGRAYHGGEHSKVIENIGNKTTTNTQQQPMATQEKSDREKEIDQLTALKDKAGSVGKIRVSTEYKSKCAACHGSDGSGMQDGKKLMGPKLIGQSAEKIYKDLIDFKDGRKENVIMKGLLINISEEELKKYANEISEFSTKEEVLSK